MMAPRKPLEVTVVCPFGSLGGGAEEWLLSAIDNAEALRFRAVLMASGPLREAFVDRKIPVCVLPTTRNLRSIARTSIRLRGVLKAHRPDVVVGNGAKAQLAAAPAARSLGLPSVWVKHDRSFDRYLAKSLGRLSTLVVATAFEVGQPTGRCDLIIIEPARPPEPHPAAAAVAELARRGLALDDRPTLVMLGRLVPYKGVDVAVKALARAGGEPWRLVIIGGDDNSAAGETARLSELARELDVIDRVDFLGRITGAGQLLRAFSALAVLTRPSDSRSPRQEGFGMVATEAMLAGLPVIYGGPGPIAGRIASEFGPAGVVVPVDDPAAVAQALSRLSDPAVRESMGSAGRVVAELQPDARAVAARFVRVLESAYDMRRAARR